MTTPFHPRSLPGADNYADEPPPPYEESSSTSSLSPPPFVTTSPQNPPSQQPQYHPLVPPPFYSPTPPSSSSQTITTTSSTTTTTTQSFPPNKVGFIPYGEEKSRLEKLLSQHKWKAYYGPKPRTLTSALRKAALWGDRAFVRAILDVGGAEIRGGGGGGSGQQQQQHTNTCVHEALRGPKPDIALEILSRYMGDRGPGGGKGHQWILDSRDSVTGVMPLHVAAESGDVRVVLALVDMGAEVDAVDGIGRTALQMAARYRKLEVVDGLLDCGAEVGRVKRSLWDKWKEGSKERELLGGWEVVSGVLRDAVGRRRALGLDHGGMAEEGQDGADEQEAVVEEDEEEKVQAGGIGLRNLQIEDVGLRGYIAGTPSGNGSRTGSGGRSSGGVDIGLGEGALYRNVMGNITGSASRPSPETGNLNWQLIQAALLASNLSETDPPVRRILHTRSSLQSRAPHQSFIHSPEYEGWRADCETLLAESRRQKERNRQEDERRLGMQAKRISTHGSTYIL